MSNQSTQQPLRLLLQLPSRRWPVLRIRGAGLSFHAGGRTRPCCPAHLLLLRHVARTALRSFLPTPCPQSSDPCCPCCPSSALCAVGVYYFWVDLLPGADMMDESDAPRMMRLSHPESLAFWHVPLLRTDGAWVAGWRRAGPPCGQDDVREGVQAVAQAARFAANCFQQGLAWEGEDGKIWVA